MNRWLPCCSLALLLGLAACGRSVDPATAVAESESLIAAGKSGEARILLKQALAKDADIPGAREVLARIALSEGDSRAASAELAAMAGVDPASASPQLAELQADIALQKGDVETAAKWLDGSGEKIAEPRRTQLRARLVRAQGGAAEALSLLRAGRQAHPDDESLAVETAAVLADMGNANAAIEELDRHLADEKRSRASALRARGELVLSQGQAQRAVTDLKAALAAAREDWPLAERKGTEIALANAMLAVPDIEAAKAQLAHIESNWPGMLGSVMLQARLDLHEGRNAEAAERLTKLLEQAPDNAQLKYMLADALIRTGNLGRAAELLEQLVASEPGVSPARRTLADLMMRQSRPDRVIALLGQEGELPVTAAGSSELVALARQVRARAGQQIAALSEQLKQKPGDAAVVAELAAAHVANGDPAAALATLGPAQPKGWSPNSAGARISALLTLNNEIEANRVVDLLLAPDSGASAATLVAAADAAGQQQRTTMASRLLDRAVMLDGNNVDIKMRLATLAFNSKHYAPAEELLNEVLKLQPNNLAARLAVPRVMEAKGDMAGARTRLQEAVKQLPESLEPALMLAALELRAERQAEALKVLDALIAAHPQGRAALAAGNILADARLLDEARNRYRIAAEQDDDNAGYWYTLGEAEYALGDKAAALASMQKSAQLQPASLQAAMLAVRFAVEQGDGAAARRTASATVAALPNSANAWVLQGAAALAIGDAELARSSYAKASSLFPSAGAAIGEFNAHLKLKSPRAAVPLAEWLAREPSDVNARRLLSDYYLSVGDDRSAMSQLEIILRAVPNDSSSLNNLAWLLRESDPERAERLASQAYAIAPENADVADTLGMIYVARGKHDEALPLLAKAASAKPDNRAIQYHHGLALHGAGQGPAAREALERALAGNVDFTGRAEARKLLEDL